MRRRLAVAIAAVAVLGLLACGSAGEQVRRSTYPPEFDYRARGEVAATMHQLADHARALEELISAVQLGREDRERIVAELETMLTLARSLQHRGAPSNRPILDERLPYFVRDIEVARDSVLRDPPSYFLAAGVPGACSHCHRAPGRFRVAKW